MAQLPGEIPEGESFVGEFRYQNFRTPTKKATLSDVQTREVWDSGAELERKNTELESVASINTLKR